MGNRHFDVRLIRVSRRGLLALGFAATTSASLGASAIGATPPPAAALTAQDMADLRRITAYLTGIRTMAGRFRQIASDGTTATGSLWMVRPGRMRFEYDPPSPILLIADQSYVYYVDKQLAQMSKVGLKSTPAWFLLRDPITFDDLVVTRFERGANLLRVTVVAPAEPDNGSLTMVFGNEPLALRQWTIVDQQRRATTVSIYDAQFGIALDPELFIYRDPYGRQY